MAEIIRVYGSRERAQSAIGKLLRSGFTEDLIQITQYPPQDGHWSVSVRAPFGTGQRVTTILDSDAPVGVPNAQDRNPDVDAIARLSAWKSPGAISKLSGHKSPGSISRLSRGKSPGAISRLSARKSSGAISRLSAWKSPGAISKLSKSTSIGAIGRLSEGWYFSSLLGLPLLLRSDGARDAGSVSGAAERHAGRY